MVRAIVIALALLAGAPLVAQAQTAPLIIAHRGASGERPEHTRAAYDLAIEHGVDVIEPDLVMSRDGALIVRHENEIGGTTDVAERPGFAGRRRTQRIDGVEVTGWFTEDFTLAELKTLRARERLPELRPANTAWDGREPILTFAEVVEIARAGSARTGRMIGVAPELKHPSHFQGLGLEMEDVFVGEVERLGLAGRDAPILIQCFEVGTLERLAARIEAPLLQLVAAGDGPADRPDLSWAGMTRPEGLAAIAAYAGWIGVEAGLVVDAAGRATPLVADAHAAGLKVAAWTFRAENAFLPPRHRRGDDPAGHGDLTGWIGEQARAGVDAVFSDFPEAAAEVAKAGDRQDQDDPPRPVPARAQAASTCSPKT